MKAKTVWHDWYTSGVQIGLLDGKIYWVRASNLSWINCYGREIGVKSWGARKILGDLD